MPHSPCGMEGGEPYSLGANTGFASRYRPCLPVGRQGNTRFWRVGYGLPAVGGLSPYAPRAFE